MVFVLLVYVTVVVTVEESDKYKTHFLTIQEKKWAHRMIVTENTYQWAKSRLLVQQLFRSSGKWKWKPGILM